MQMIAMFGFEIGSMDSSLQEVLFACQVGFGVEMGSLDPLFQKFYFLQILIGLIPYAPLNTLIF